MNILISIIILGLGSGIWWMNEFNYVDIDVNDNAGKKTILESLNISEAVAVIVALDNSEKLHLVCDILKTMQLDAKVIIKVNRFNEKEELQKVFPQYEIVVGTEQVARAMVDSILKCELVQ